MPVGPDGVAKQVMADRVMADRATDLPHSCNML